MRRIWIQFQVDCVDLWVKAQFVKYEILVVVVDVSGAKAWLDLVRVTCTGY